MTPHKLTTLLGTPATTFLLVAAAVIEAVSAATGADVGPGIVGVVAGALAAIAALVLVAWRWDRVSDTTQHVLLGYATFGLTLLFLSGLSYVNVPGARETLSVPLNAGIALAVAVFVAGAVRQADRAASGG